MIDGAIGVKPPPRKQGRFIAGHSYYPETQIKPGNRLNPDTEIHKGNHLSLATEFKPGTPAYNKCPVGTIRIRVETHTKLPRAWVKTGEPNIWKKRAIVVWESINGPLPIGMVVHHRDRNSMNDDFKNLIYMTRRDHMTEHRKDYIWTRMS